MFATFFKLYRWYQIAQRITYDQLQGKNIFRTYLFLMPEVRKTKNYTYVKYLRHIKIKNGVNYSKKNLHIFSLFFYLPSILLISIITDKTWEKKIKSIFHMLSLQIHIPWINYSKLSFWNNFPIDTAKSYNINNK